MDPYVEFENFKETEIVWNFIETLMRKFHKVSQYFTKFPGSVEMGF